MYIGSSFIVMIGLLIMLAYTFIYSRKEHISFRIVLELFMGWILIACIANLHLMLVSFDIYVFPIVATILSIIIAIGINSFLQYRYNSYIPSYVCIWALI